MSAARHAASVAHSGRDRNALPAAPAAPAAQVAPVAPAVPTSPAAPAVPITSNLINVAQKLAKPYLDPGTLYFHQVQARRNRILANYYRHYGLASARQLVYP